jgi:hypothetical protein
MSAEERGLTRIPTTCHRNAQCTVHTETGDRVTGRMRVSGRWLMRSMLPVWRASVLIRNIDARSVVLLCIVHCALCIPAEGQAPLPDPKAFGAEVRKRMLTDRELQSQYTFVERREEISISKLGKVSAGPVKTYEVYPSVEPGNTYKRLIAVDGVPLPPEELARRDRIHRDDVLREAAKRDRESPQDRQKRLQNEAKERDEWNRTLDEVFEVYDIRLIGRDRIAGAVTVVATLDPKPDSRPRTDGGKLMKKVRARAWVSEADYQVVKVVAEMIDDLTYGWGIVGRLHKGTVATFERTRVNGEVWLPARVEIKGTGRALFRRFTLSSVTTYSDYRKFNVSTGETFQR